MKISITGAHRTGKTTLAEKLQEVLKGYVCKEEVYYELQESGIAFSETPVIDDYLILIEHSIEQITGSDDNVIFDRCPADIFAYIQAVNGSGNLKMHTLYSRVQDVMNEIDILVFVPIEKPDLIGCPESELPGLRHKVNEILNESVWEFNSKALKVSGSPSHRRDQVIKLMSEV